jgi:S1-C subfamily serine protease
VEVGEWVLAVGNPYGYDNTVTVGVISGRKRHLSDGSSDYQDLLQTDAAINPGNSGGPLVNLDGRVIGINTAIIPFAQGIGFAIPVNVVKNICAQLQTRGKVVRPYIGVYLQEFSRALADYLEVPFREGVLITGVMPGSPAEKGGLKKGAIVDEMDNRKVKTADDFRKAIQLHKVGDKVKLLVWSSGKQEVLTIIVGEMP